MFFRFPPDARWNPELSVVEFGIGVGEYEGVVHVSRRVFQILLPEAPTPDGNVEITGRDLREREPRAAAHPTTNRAGATLSR
jgi:hypothetical protein